MQFVSEYKRNIYSQLVLNTLPSLLLGLIVSLFFGIWGFFLTLLTILTLKFGLWIFLSIVYWAVFLLYDKDKAAERIADLFEDKNYPEPREEVYDSPEQYLNWIAEDDKAPYSARVSAACSSYEIAYHRLNGQYQAIFRLYKVLEEGMRKYKKRTEEKRKLKENYDKQGR